jgi:hypothetical protein
MVTPRGTDTQRQDDKVKVGFVLGSAEAGITAQADGTKANATPLTCRLNQIATVAGANDSVLLPPGEVGMEVFIANDGANVIQVFGAGSDTIDAVATATGVVLTNAERAWYYCVSVASGVGAWVSQEGPKST